MSAVVHLVSDATGETIAAVARAAQAQFADHATLRQHIFIRREGDLDEVMAAVAAEPGPVLFTLADAPVAERLARRCAEVGVDAVDVLRPAVVAYGRLLEADPMSRPGGQHGVTSDYFDRVAAIEFSMSNDDGRGADRWREADVVLTGVSRVSKTPTCLYLACRGVRAANIPLTPGGVGAATVREAAAAGALVVGLTISSRRLALIRRRRLEALGQAEGGAYGDDAAVRGELTEAMVLFEGLGLPVIDVTQRSIEETAAAILAIQRERRAAAEAGA